MSSKKLPKDVRAQIESIIKAAEMQNMRVNKPGELFSPVEYSDEVRDATRVYRRTWIIDPLKELLELDDGIISDSKRLMYVDYPF